MWDRITQISSEGGLYGKGEITAEMDIKPDLWFFKCHFENDPVMPGCLGLDAMWQLVGFFLGWLGGLGRGRAISVGDVKFSGQVLNTAKKLTYQINIKRVIMRKLVMGIADGPTEVHKVTIARQALKDYEASEGLFPSEHLPERTAAARERFAKYLEHDIASH